jgi:hypothetical protein
MKISARHASWNLRACFKGKKGSLAVLEERIWKQAVGNEQLCGEMSDTPSNAI